MDNRDFTAWILLHIPSKNGEILQTGHISTSLVKTEAVWHNTGDDKYAPMSSQTSVVVLNQGAVIAVKETMSVCRFVFLVTCFLSVHAGLADITDPGIPDIRKVLLVVSDLTQQIEELKKAQMNDHQKISSLEAKYEKISEENYRLRNRIGTLEKFHRIDNHQASTSPEPIPRSDSAPDNFRKLVMKRIPSGCNMTAHPDISNTTTQRVHGQNHAESTTKNNTRPREQRPTQIVDKNGGIHIRSQQPKQGAFIRAEDSTVVVAFSAQLSYHITDPGDRYSMIYGDVVTNVGNGYNPTTGWFTCQQAGTYVFTWSVGMVHTGYAYTSLVKNGRNVAYSFTGDDHYRPTSSQTAVLELSPGDVISVRVGSHSASPMLWALYTSFSGFILG